MQNKEVSTKDSTILKITKRMICLCWIVLIGCFIIKLFGGNFFEIVYRSKFYERIASNAVLLKVVQFIFFFIGSYLYFLTLFKNKYKWQLAILVLCLFPLRFFNDVIRMSLEIIAMIIIPMVFCKHFKIRWYEPLLFYMLMFLFQTIAILTKNISLINFPSNSIIGVIFLIDYYIMLLLMYLYRLKGELNSMGLIWLDWLHTDETKCKAVLSDNEKKITKHQEIVDDAELKNDVKKVAKHKKAIAKIKAENIVIKEALDEFSKKNEKKA